MTKLEDVQILSALLNDNFDEILADWFKEQLATGYRRDLIREQELRDQSNEFLRLLADFLRVGAGPQSQESKRLLEMLANLSRSRGVSGFTPTETATFVFSLKKPLFNASRKDLGKDMEGFAKATWTIDAILDQLGLYTTEMHMKAREEVIARQQADMLELSTPVVKLWDGILALPMIGTLDSSRTQVVMETLLQRIVETGSQLAIIDITGVPTVDTLVAQHLLKTITAARLMGAECIVSGIRPQIASTIVHLGVDLGDIVTKATLADAFKVALQKLGRNVSMPGQSEKSTQARG